MGWIGEEKEGGIEMRKSNTKDRDILRNLDDDAMLLLEKVYGNGYEWTDEVPLGKKTWDLV